MSEYGVPRIPKIHLLCVEDNFIDAFEEACLSQKMPALVDVQIHKCSLSQVPSSIHFDAIVSPSDSYAGFGGAFNSAILHAMSPRDDHLAVTSLIQKSLHREWRGFAPPGTCTIVRIPDSFRARSRNVWGTRRIALCTTMRAPDDVRWDREVVYECIWSLLCAINNHNRLIEMGAPKENVEMIESILMTPLATGVGRVSAARWAAQVVLAIRHYLDAEHDPEKNMQNVGRQSAEVRQTWSL